MFQTLKRAWSVPEIRKKLLYTLLMVVIFRLGSAIAVPYLNTDVVNAWMDQNAIDGNFLEYLNTITGGALSQATIFSLSITPYINASIIMQLLTYALPPLERLRDEGEEGRKKLNKITAAVALVLSVVLGTGYYMILRKMEGVTDKDNNVLGDALKYSDGWEGWFSAIVIIALFVAGASFVV